jgi:lycopene beta-cyclase
MALKAPATPAIGGSAAQHAQQRPVAPLPAGCGPHRPARLQRPSRRPLAVAAAATAVRKPRYDYSYRDPAPWPKDIPLQQHDAQKQPYVDLVVAGGGPSGIAVAARVARQGFKVVVIDPEPLGIWPNNYGVWVDEFDAMGLKDCLEVVWPKAKVWLDNDTKGEK